MPSGGDEGTEEEPSPERDTMKRRLLWLVLPLVVAATPPVLYNGKTWWAQAKQRVAPLLSLGSSPQSGEPTAAALAAPRSAASPSVAGHSGPDGTLPTADVPRRPRDTPTQADLADVLRFDITPGWVMERWPWISAGLSQLPLQGYRVPLVTGTGLDDLAGSLTYYFNAQQKVERITFQGTTGDASKLLRLLISRYGFGRRLTNDPGLFRYEVPQARGAAKSLLNVRLTQPNNLYQRYQVDLTIERPQ